MRKLLLAMSMAMVVSLMLALPAFAQTPSLCSNPFWAEMLGSVCNPAPESNPEPTPEPPPEPTPSTGNPAPGVAYCSASPDKSLSLTTNEVRMLELHNNARRNNGLHPYCLDSRLYVAAKKHSQDMINNNYFSHTGGDGSSVGTRVSREGYSWQAIGENIAWGTGSNSGGPDNRFNAWMNSSGHRSNILSNRTQFGVAEARGTFQGYNDVRMWTGVYATPR